MHQDTRNYDASAPLATHWRIATCAEVDCRALEQGWQTSIFEDDTVPPLPPNATEDKHMRRMMSLRDLSAKQAYYIRHLSGRHFTEHRDETGATVFTFPPGQECFTEHKVRIDRPELFIVTDRGARRVHRRPEDWAEDLAQHADAINKARQG